ncbi:MAG: hypothetical protein ABTQ25_12080 [Nitrosomonas ureae]|jgi:hypothetical protein
MQVTGRRATLAARATTVAGGPVDWIVGRQWITTEKGAEHESA